MKVVDKSASDTIWRLKGFFIFTVIFAHIPLHGGGVLVSICKYIGVVGVPSFLVMSGFFDFGSKRPLTYRLKNLLIPLIVWGSITYLIQMLATHENTRPLGVLVGWLQWTFGSGTWLYFVPVLCLCIILTRFVNKWILLVLALISTGLGTSIIPYNSLITPYLNPFNFLFYFLIGRMAREYEWKFDDYRVLVASVLLGTVSLALWHAPNPNYFNLLCIPFCISVFIISWHFFKLLNTNWIMWIGKVSFVIYFCHMQIVGKMNGLFSRFYETPIELLKYPIAFMVVLAFVYTLQRVLQSLHAEGILKCLGYRA